MTLSHCDHVKNGNTVIFTTLALLHRYLWCLCHLLLRQKQSNWIAELTLIILPVCVTTDIVTSTFLCAVLPPRKDKLEVMINQKCKQSLTQDLRTRKWWSNRQERPWENHDENNDLRKELCYIDRVGTKRNSNLLPRQKNYWLQTLL